MTKSLLSLLQRGIASNQEIGKFTLPPLPYAYDALEPVISKDILQTHHQGHHNTYVTQLNTHMERFQSLLQQRDITGAIAAFNLVKFNGGGHINHCLFWENLRPPHPHSQTPNPQPNLPVGIVSKEIEKVWGGFDKFQAMFIEQSASIQGSGYGWLALDPSTGRLVCTSTGNQDILQTRGLEPLLTVDVWEHSYYLQYRNKRIDYLKNIWNIVDWDCVNARLESALAKH